MYLKTIVFEVIMRGIICMAIGFISALGIKAVYDKVQEAKGENIEIPDPEDSTEQESSETVQG